MTRVLITGSADGLGRATAATLQHEGRQVIVHVRDRQRLGAVAELVDRGALAVVGDLADPDQTRDLALQVNDLGRVDAVIHNAGVSDGAAVLPVNVVAPYVLTALIERPGRLVYLSSGMHHSGRPELVGQDWSGARRTASYSDSKLFVTTLALAVARRWPDVITHAVDPGWVPTRMGGRHTPEHHAPSPVRRSIRLTRVLAGLTRPPGHHGRLVGQPVIVVGRRIGRLGRVHGDHE